MGGSAGIGQLEWIIIAILVLILAGYGTLLIMARGKKEKCVMCGEPTSYSKNDPVLKRVGYIMTIGQLCKNCNWF